LAVESKAEQDRADHDQNQEDREELHPAHRALPYGAAMTHNANVRGRSACSGPASLLLLAQHAGQVRSSCLEDCRRAAASGRRRRLTNVRR
jgi:hypothetical protein